MTDCKIATTIYAHGMSVVCLSENKIGERERSKGKESLVVWIRMEFLTK
jgi:hypothetical protein